MDDQCACSTSQACGHGKHETSRQSFLEALERVSTVDFSEYIEYHSIASMLVLTQTYSDRSEIYDL